MVRRIIARNRRLRKARCAVILLTSCTIRLINQRQNKSAQKVVDLSGTSEASFAKALERAVAEPQRRLESPGSTSTSATRAIASRSVRES